MNRLEAENRLLNEYIWTVDNYLKGLNEYSKNILVQHYLLQYTFKKIADNFDKKESAIKREIRKLVI